MCHNPETHSKFNQYEYTMIIDFELYNAHAENAEIEMLSVLSTKVVILSTIKRHFPQSKIQPNKRKMP